MTGMKFIDFWEAFIVTTQNILLKKMNTIDFSNHATVCVKSYLSNGSFRVNL